MSKAFTRESDDVPEQPMLRRPSTELAPVDGSPLTAVGARRFREELGQLVQVERPTVAGMVDSAETRQRLEMLDRRILQLQGILGSTVVLKPPVGSEDRVGFGATVTVVGRGGEVARYRLVGPIEVDLDRNCVSWRSPIAKALLNSRKGERVLLGLPSGEEELEVLEVTYE